MSAPVREPLTPARIRLLRCMTKSRIHGRVGIRFMVDDLRLGREKRRAPDVVREILYLATAALREPWAFQAAAAYLPPVAPTPRFT